jgi:hypothetical protein
MGVGGQPHGPAAFTSGKVPAPNLQEAKFMQNTI